MSAFLVSKKHIDVLVYARSIPNFWNLPEGEITDTQLGHMLWNENMLSLLSRYGTEIDEELIRSYSYTKPIPITMPIINILKSISCYEYQSCEHKNWKRSPSYRYCRTVSEALVGHLPGYEDAPWGID